MISLIVVGSFPMVYQADSLWDPTKSLYDTDRREIRVGDIVTIQISEQTTAAQEATTRTSKESELNADILSAWDRIANVLGNETDRRDYEFELRGEDDYLGSGQTSRRSRVTAIVTAIVTEVLDSGNLFVVGEHKVKVNNEVQTIRVSGIVRPADISPRNSVFSYQLARAEVSINGAGVVGQKQSPGIMTKVFNWFF